MSLGEVSTLPLVIGLLGFGVTAVAYLVLAALVRSAHPRTPQSHWLVVALLASASWGALMLTGAWAGVALSSWLLVVDALRIALWILFLAALLTSSADSNVGGRFGRAVTTAAVTLTVIAIFTIWLASVLGQSPMSSGFALLPMLSLPVLGLLALEQVFRNATLRQRAFLKPLSIAFGAVLAVDLFLYSQGTLFASLSPYGWLLRGVASFGVAPLLLVAINRHPDWAEELSISRQAVFYTTGLIGAGLYLVAMGIGGFVLGSRQEDWAAPIQLLFLACTGAVFLFALFSADVRRNVKVFISKHFFRDRYDYRAEWLRLTRALAEQDHETSLAERGLGALTAIISSPGGELWLARAARDGFDRRAASSPSALPTFLQVGDEMVQFLQPTAWVVDTHEYAADPEKYKNAFAPDSPWMRAASIVVPLTHERRLVGIARLDRPALLGSLDFKDHDLLKVAGRQVAVFLVQERAQEQLSETRQFEAFSKLTTFLMHDLKNLIAQQELVVGNARRFRHRPEFVDDAFETMEGSVKRMRRLLERLQGVTERDHTARIELRKLLQDACSACSDRRPAPNFLGSENVFVSMDRDKLNMIVTHAIRNAQDATADDGRVEVRLVEEDRHAVIEVEDTGTGMTPEFVRNELFKPFSSTKGAQGMGIGAYQVRETVRAVGGDVEVASEPSRGTVLRLRIPLVDMAHGAKEVVTSESAGVFPALASREVTRL